MVNVANAENSACCTVASHTAQPEISPVVLKWLTSRQPGVISDSKMSTNTDVSTVCDSCVEQKQQTSCQCALGTRANDLAFPHDLL